MANSSGPSITLDDLLQQALADFEKPDLLPSEKSHPAREPEHTPPDLHPELSEANDKFFRDTSKEINDVLTSLEQEDPALAQQLRTLSNFAHAVNSPDDQAALHNFSQFASMFKETLQTITSQTGVAPDELVDDDLSDIMNNLDKLAMGDFPSSTAPEGSVPFPLGGDFVKTMLSKEIMLDSLKKCQEEFGPWITENRGKVPLKDMERYETQLRKVGDLIREYENGDEENNGFFERIMARMAELQELGEFPEQLMEKVDTRAFMGRQEKKREEPEVPDCKTS